MNYTKGEWRLIHPASGVILILANNGEIARLETNSLLKAPELYANAHLIAAVPDMAQAGAELDIAIGQAIIKIG